MQLLSSSLVCLLPLVLSALFYHRLPDLVAIHWSTGGIPNGFSPRIVAAFALPLMLLAVNVVVHIMLENDPKKKNTSPVLKMIMKWTIPIVAVFAHTLTIINAIAGPADMQVYITLLVGLVFVIAGNYLPKCKQNYTMGIRLPWTLHSEDNWNRTHRFAGFLWVFCGIAFIVNAFLSIEWLYFAILLIMMFLPAIYSFVLYRKSLAGKDNDI